MTDLAGREATVPEGVQRIVLGESRFVPALAILDREQPLARVVGRLRDFVQADPSNGYWQYRNKFAEIEPSPLIGHASADSFGIEKVLALKAAPGLAMGPPADALSPWILRRAYGMEARIQPEVFPWC